VKDVTPVIATGEFCFVRLNDRHIEAPYISIIVPSAKAVAGGA
jgi:hypothetical protein